MEYVKSAKTINLLRGKSYQRLINEELGSFGIKAGHVVLKKGENVGLHNTGQREEIVIVLKGRGRASIGKEKKLFIDKTKILYIPPYTEHDIKNCEAYPLEYIYITSSINNGEKNKNIN